MESLVPGSSFVVYRQRWLVLLALALLNLSNNALWISYSSVTDVTALYFGKSVNEVDLLGTVSFIVGIPFCVLATYVVETWGLRTGMYLGSVLTLLGGLVRALSTMSTLITDRNIQFYLSVTGQALTGMGNPFAVALPTKVSQNWFNEKERALATGILAMSLPLGIVLGQGCSPLIVKFEEDVPTMNLIWLGPAVITMLLVIFFVRSSVPPSPPSQSSALALANQHRTTFREYLEVMKNIVSNRSFMNLFLSIGGAVGFFNAFSTQLSQLMCSRGYSNEFSGLCGSLLLGTGFIGAIASGLLVERTGKMEETAKVFYSIAGIFGILVAEFVRKPDSEVLIALSCALFGVFGFGMYPLGLELSVEATYPTDESIGTALIFLSGQIQGLILVIISTLLEQPLSLADQQLATCSNGVTPRDHTNFLLVLGGYMTAIVVIFVIFFSTPFKRSEANKKQEEPSTPTSTSNESTLPNLPVVV